MTPRLVTGSLVAWWCDRHDVTPASVTNIPALSVLSEDEQELIAKWFTEDMDLRDDFVPSTSLSPRDLRAALRLMRRGILLSSFHLTPSIGEAFLKKMHAEKAKR